MSFFKQPKFWTMSIAALVALGIVYLIWQWEVERIEVGPGQYLVRIHRWGKNLAEGEIVAPDPAYKGVMFEVLPEGRHFLNPLFWSHEVHEMVHVPVGKCLVLTRQFGRDIPQERLAAGDILAHQDNQNPIDGERGVLREVLLPGSYRLNPYAYTWEEVPAVEVRVEQVGVRCLKVGLDPRNLSPDKERGNYVVPDGYRGVQQTPVSAGTYYINPHVETITPVEVRSHRVELTDIEFPSRDGFIIKPQVVVEYAVRPEKAPELLVRLTDEGIIHQSDSTDEQKEANEVLQKVLLPHIRGYARIEGSNFDARDFILVQSEVDGNKITNAREALQQTLLSKVKPRCAELGVEIRAVTLADLRPPEELADQIAQRELARVEREKNLVRIKQFQAEQELKGKESLKQQAAEKVTAETRLVQGKTKSEQLKQVEQARLVQELANAQLKLDAAKKHAEATLARGTAEAAVIQLQNEAEVAGIRTAVAGFGNVQNLAQYQILLKLAPALKEIFVSDESEFARLFAHYLSQAAGTGKVMPAPLPQSSTVQTPAAAPVSTTSDQNAP